MPRALRQGASTAAALRVPSLPAAPLAVLLLVPTAVLVASVVATEGSWGVPVAVVTTGCTIGLVATVGGLVRAASRRPAFSR